MSLAHAFDWDPPSESISAALNERGAVVCAHGRSPCFVFCGVQRHPLSGCWEPISTERRAQWFGRFFGLLYRDRERAYVAIEAIEQARKHGSKVNIQGDAHD